MEASPDVSPMRRSLHLALDVQEKQEMWEAYRREEAKLKAEIHSIETYFMNERCRLREQKLDQEARFIKDEE